MDKAIVEFIDFTWMKSEKKEVSVPERFDSISFHYDGGRCAIYMNGTEVFSNLSAGNDFCVEFEIKGVKP